MTVNVSPDHLQNEFTKIDLPLLKFHVNPCMRLLTKIDRMTDKLTLAEVLKAALFIINIIIMALLRYSSVVVNRQAIVGG